MEPGLTREAPHRDARWFFAFFFVSGFCSLVYEVVWLRLGMAKFGVTTPMVSIVLSVFMAGLGLGSWAGGRFIRRFDASPARVPLRLYATLELLIGLSGFVVPFLIDVGYTLLRDTGQGVSWGSSLYYLASGAWIAFALLPWCSAMGATFPFAMAAYRKSRGREAERVFSFLYLANLLGAVLGTIVPAVVLIELYGFRGTLHITTALNFALAATVFLFSARLTDAAGQPALTSHTAPTGHRAPIASHAGILWLLFTTGLCSMAMEVIWMREFTVYLGSVVYAFAAVLALYLVANYAGSLLYRARARRGAAEENRTVWIVMGFAALLPLLTADPHLRIPGALNPEFGADFLWGMLRAGLGVMPFSFLVGFATPMLVDRFSRGNPDSAGRAYAVNVVGSILGPLLSGFAILPWAGERAGLGIVSLPLFAAGLVSAARASRDARSLWKLSAWPLYAAGAALSLPMLLFTGDYASQIPHRVELRDYTATVIAAGTGMEKRLLTNGTGMTRLTTITKMMAHIPLSLLPHPPSNGLVICFGMGTSFRSMLSWGIHTTAVELVPSVPKLFGYFHPDGPALLALPRARLVIDDGRRFLERSSELFDVITLDPPPPVPAPASSLLYSREFLGLLRRHLRPGGIAQVWLPGGDDQTEAAIARALSESFPYVRAFGSIEQWGTHFLASAQPIGPADPAHLPQPLPDAARQDLLEWEPGAKPEDLFAKVFSQEQPLANFISPSPATPAMDDDRPINEYFLLRRAWPDLPR